MSLRRIPKVEPPLCSCWSETSSEICPGIPSSCSRTRFGCCSHAIHSDSLFIIVLLSTLEIMLAWLAECYIKARICTGTYSRPKIRVFLKSSKAKWRSEPFINIFGTYVWWSRSCVWFDIGTGVARTGVCYGDAPNGRKVFPHSSNKSLSQVRRFTAPGYQNRGSLKDLVFPFYLIVPHSQSLPGQLWYFWLLPRCVFII